MVSNFNQKLLYPEEIYITRNILLFSPIFYSQSAKFFPPLGILSRKLQMTLIYTQEDIPVGSTLYSSSYFYALFPKANPLKVPKAHNYSSTFPCSISPLLISDLQHALISWGNWVKLNLLWVFMAPIARTWVKTYPTPRKGYFNSSVMELQWWPSLQIFRLF